MRIGLAVLAVSVEDHCYVEEVANNRDPPAKEVCERQYLPFLSQIHVMQDDTAAEAVPRVVELLSTQTLLATPQAPNVIAETGASGWLRSKRRRGYEENFAQSKQSC